MSRFSKVFMCASLFTAGAWAQTWEVSPVIARAIIGGQDLGSIADQNRQDDDTKLKAKYGYGVRGTLNTPGYYGHEVSYIVHFVDLTAKTRPDTKNPDYVLPRKDRIRVHELSYNFLLYMMPKGERWRPYITGGIQAHEYGEPRIAEWPTGKSRNYGANYGAGIKLKLVDHLLIRADFRHFFGGKPYDLQYKNDKLSGGMLQQMEGTFGFTIAF